MPFQLLGLTHTSLYFFCIKYNMNFILLFRHESNLIKIDDNLNIIIFFFFSFFLFLFIYLFNFFFASNPSNMKWQTDISQPLCVNWTNHFYNTHLRHNNFLHPIQAASSALEIHNQYEQNTGLLGVAGTPNVNGVTKFEV